MYESQKPGTVRNLTLKIDEEGMLSLADIQSVGYKVVVDRRGFKVFGRGSSGIPKENCLLHYGGARAVTR